jgi:thiol:disulfide interchange protein DsbD
MLVFTVLGLGMASPYLLLAGFPALMRFLPKPGEWMVHLKQFMGFPLLATAVWLAWVLGRQSGVDGLVALLSLLVIGGLSAWILGKWMALHHPGTIRMVAGALALVIFLPSLAAVLVYVNGIESPHRTAQTSKPGSLVREPYTAQALQNPLKAGSPVFLDFTADWCITCKVNEKVALGNKAVIERLQNAQVITMKADWTHSDPEVSRALAQFGRSSIPFYVLYSGKGAESYETLPELLQPSTVLEALDRVLGPSSSLSPASGNHL